MDVMLNTYDMRPQHDDDLGERRFPQFVDRSASDEVRRRVQDVVLHHEKPETRNIQQTMVKTTCKRSSPNNVVAVLFVGFQSVFLELDNGKCLQVPSFSNL